MKMNYLKKGCLAFFVSVVACSTSLGAMFTNTVFNTNDTGAGSFRAAIILANARSLADTNLIVFAITNASATGVQSITPATSLDVINRRVIIDGYTQPGASSNTLMNADNAAPLIEINGATLGNNGDGLVFSPTAGGSTVRGLVIDNGWSRGIIIRATNTVIEGCFVGTDPTGLIARGNSIGLNFDFSFDSSFSRVGGTNVGARNLISGNAGGIVLQSGSNQVVQGNLIGLDKTGTNGLTASGQGVQVTGASNVQIGGTNAAARNVIASPANGAGIVISGSIGTRVQGNFIGTDVTGNTGLGLTTGIRVDNGAAATQIGGPTAIPGTPPGNVINAVSALGVGIVLDSSASSNVVQGNLIGTDASGTRTIGNTSYGVQIVGPFNTIASNVIAASGQYGIFMDGDHGVVHASVVQGNFIGPDITGTNLLGNANGVFIDRSFANTLSNNIIAGNGGVGVIVSAAIATNNAVLANSIFANGGLGIDLSSGANLSQTNPIITSISTGGGNVSLSGSLKSGTNAVYHLEFFSNASCDGSGFGEGQVYLGVTNVTSDSGGNAGFSVILANPAGHANFTATATDTNGNTSEFSFCASVSGPCSITCPANIIVSTAPNQCSAIVNFSTMTSGNCGAVNCSPPSGSSFPKGTNTVICTSASGTNCSFTIVVQDLQPPTILCPANITTNVPQAQTSVVVNYSTPITTDNCGIATTNCSPPSGSLFPLGTTLVTCTAIDTSGNTNTCSFNVTVAHTNTPPVAQCHNVTTNADGSCQAAVSATAVDNGSFDSDGTITNRALNPPGPYPKGTNAVTLTVVDNLGASNSCATTIIIVDTSPPVISCPANIITNAPHGQTGVVVTFPSATVTDNCPGAPSIAIATPPSGSVFPLGITTVICSTNDASGNTNSCSFTVTVNPTAAILTWNGSGANSFWTNAANWVGNVAPVNGDALVFPTNATRLVNTNTVGGPTSLSAITLSGSNYVIFSPPLTLANGLTNSPPSGRSNRLEAVISLGGDQVWRLFGALTIASNVTLSTFHLDITPIGTLDVLGNITGSAGSQLLLDNSVLKLNGSANSIPDLVVNAGNLEVDGVLSGQLLIASGGRLYGKGTVPAFTCGGEVIPGGSFSPGQLTVSAGPTIFESGSDFQADLFGSTTPGIDYDQLRVSSPPDLSGANLFVTPSYSAQPGETFVIITNTGIAQFTTTFSGRPEGSIYVISSPANEFRLSYVGGNGNDVVLTRVPLGTASAPRLSIERALPNAVRLLWPTNPAGFSLQFNTNLAGTNWVGASPAPSVVGTNNVVTNTIIPGQQLYRLKK